MTTDEKLPIIQKLRGRGVPDTALAEAFDISRQWINANLGIRPLSTEKYGIPEIVEPLTGNFSEVIYSWRSRHGLTQSQACDLIGVHLNSWNRWELGKETAANEKAIRMLLAFMDGANRKR